MSTYTTTRSLASMHAHQARCAQWAQDLRHGLGGLDDIALRELGTWPDAVAATVASLLEARGCAGGR